MAPFSTGASVLAVRYKGGVLMAADTLVSYGTMARFHSVRRIEQFGDDIIVGFTGDHADFQEISEELQRKIRMERCLADGSKLTPRECHAFLKAWLYQRRSKIDPLYNYLVVGGKDFLGYVDLYGTAFEADFVATGYGEDMALPLLREQWHEGMEEAEAAALLRECLRVLWMRHTRASNEAIYVKVTGVGAEFSAPRAVTGAWAVAGY